MTELLRTGQLPPQAASEDDGSGTSQSGTTVEVEHDHAWRRIRAHRGERFAEYRCDLCALSYVE